MSLRLTAWIAALFMIGSMCFALGSHPALLRQREQALPASRVLNLVGSVAFGLSAIAWFVLPTTDEVLNIQIVNSQTFIGAACFFAGAALMVPASWQDDRASAAGG